MDKIDHMNAIKQRQDELVNLLKESGLFVRAIGEESSLFLVADDICVTHDKGKTRVVLKADGNELDISKSVASITVTFAPRQEPVYVIRSRRKAAIAVPRRQRVRREPRPDKGLARVMGAWPGDREEFDRFVNAIEKHRRG